MAIYLGHTTARRILESKLVLEDLSMEPLIGPVNCVSNKKDVRGIIADAYGNTAPNDLARLFYGKPGEPLDLIVSRKEERRAWDGVRCHVHPNGIPSRSFLLLREGILVARPELCLLQLASELSLIDTIKLVMSFCGIYRLEGDEESRSIFDRRPLMTIDDALSYLDCVEEVRGIETAKRALRLALPMSGSPMETRMVLPLYLPRHLGGFGLPRPTMNKLIQLDEAAWKIAATTQPLMAGDAVWSRPDSDQCLILEYQSKEQHDNLEAYGADYARWLALESMGHEVIFVTAHQLENVDQVAELARRVATFMGLGGPLRCPIPNAKTELLLGEVLS